jgi:hypothetical protein
LRSLANGGGVSDVGKVPELDRLARRFGIEFGRWTAVVMNADAARGIDVEADVGVKLDWAIWPGLGMFVVGLLMTVGAVIVILLIGRRASPDWTTG